MTEVSTGVMVGGRFISHEVIGAVGIGVGVLFVLFVLIKVLSVKKCLRKDSVD